MNADLIPIDVGLKVIFMSSDSEFADIANGITTRGSLIYEPVASTNSNSVM